ncbi:hypothetical protein [Vibrio parahaemolyticus]|uniref:hypothetical protein n=1 Tax=Vibrio parahaemolyticus TaxID=670 RepID=UPI0015DDA3F8|nr:hypothetical protein [Vibrio parahaemolyticus]
MMVVGDSSSEFKKAIEFVEDDLNKLEVFERNYIKSGQDIDLALKTAKESWQAISA